MSIILNIDTASEQAHVSLGKDGEMLDMLTSDSQKEHASFLQTAIAALCKKTAVSLAEIDAVAVTSGPGSYTGLRVGFASAKGLCYALNKPLIAVSSLELLTVSALQVIAGKKDILFCPMIDARRMEVFTALYNQDLSFQLPPCAMILDENSFAKELAAHQIFFFGSGANKWKNQCDHPHAIFELVVNRPQIMCTHTYHYYTSNSFTSLAYSEPFYLKEFQSFTPK